MDARLLECEVCGWLADDGDEDRYCEQHDAMQPVERDEAPLNTPLGARQRAINQERVVSILETGRP